MAWVATEYLRGYFLTGFPWVPLGNSQVTVLPVAQLASVLGVYGLSALVAYVNATLAYSLVTSGTTASGRRRECGRRAVCRRRVGCLAHRGRLAHPRGDADTRRSHPRQHRAGGQVESCPGATHLYDLHRDDARRGPPRRASTSSGRNRPRRSPSRIRSPIPRATPCCASSRARCACRFCSAAIRSYGVSRSSPRSSTTPPFNSTPTARRSRSIARFTSSRSANSFRSSGGLPLPRRSFSGSCRSRPAPARSCCRSDRIAPARRSVTRSCFRSWRATPSPRAASC